MSTIGTVKINLAAEYAAFSKGVQQAGKDVNSLAQNMEHLKRSSAGSDVFDKIRESLGRRSALGEATDLLNGGGGRLVGGLTGAADAIKNMAEQAGKLRQEFQSGQKSAGEMVEEIIKGVPVVGQFWEAGTAIRNLWTHERDDIDAANASATVMDSIIKSQRESMARLAASARDYADAWAKAQEHNQLTEMPDSTIGEKRAKDVATAQAAENDKIRSLEKERADALRKNTEDHQKTIEEGRKAASEAQTKANALSGNGADANEIAVAQARAKQLGSVVNMAVASQRDEEARINAEYNGKEILARQTSAYDQAEIVRKSQAEQQKAVKEAAERDGKAIADANAAATEADLRAKGDDYNADLAALRQHLQDRFTEIEKERQEEAKLYHSDDAENQARVNAEATAKAQAAAAQEAAEEHARSLKKQEEDEKDWNEFQKAENEEADERRKEAQKYIDVSPLQKYANEVTHINELKKQGYLTDQQAAAAIDKQNKELGSHLKQEPASKPEAEIRRFDFNLGKQAPQVNPLKELVEQGQKAQQIMQQQQIYMNYWYSTGIKTDTITADF